MRLPSPSAVFLCVATSLVLSACGGGGGGSNPVVTPTTYPASGAYGWVLKASGPTGSLQYGLSLIHPGQADAEFVIEPASSVIRDAKLVVSGSVDTGAMRASAMQAYALLYIVGGDVRRIPMQADGTAPLSRIQRAQSTSACKFVIDANDYASAQNSRFIVTTAGVDRQCNTVDDGRAEVQLTGTSVSLTPITGEPPLAALRDPSSLAPRGWLFSRTASLWNGSSNTTVQMRPALQDPLLSVVGSTYRQALVSDGVQLSVIDFSGGTAFTETPLDAATTAGNRWKLIGYDATSFYVYDDSASNDFSTPWTVLKISRSSPTASVLATGTGLIQQASMGSNRLYLTVADTINNQRVRVVKSTGVTTSDLVPADTFVSVQTGSNGIHEMWVVTGVSTLTPGYTVLMLDEATNDSILYSATGGFPVAMADADRVDFNSSESRSRFVFASSVTPATQFNGATLETFDTGSSVARVLGLLPGAADFGTDFGFASAIAGPSTYGAAFAARSVGGVLQASGSKVYSYDLGTANSLIAKTRVVN
jgi:hypothetical protein